MDKVIETIINQVAKELEVDPKEVERILVSPYKMMKETIQVLELKGKTYDECDQMKTNFNMPGLFKLYLNEYKINELNRNKDEIRNE